MHKYEDLLSEGVVFVTEEPSTIHKFGNQLYYQELELVDYKDGRQLGGEETAVVYSDATHKRDAGLTTKVFIGHTQFVNQLRFFEVWP